MRRISPAILLCLAVASPATAQRQIEERAAATPDMLVRIHNMVGSVRVTGWSRDSIVVTGTVNETAHERFGFSAVPGGAKLGIWDATDRDLQPSHLDVRVPASSSVWVKTASADIVLAGITGGVDAYSVSGRIDVNGSPREVLAESLGGAVTVSADTRSARVKTASGAIVLRGRIADATATTVSGSLTLDGKTVERGRFESVDGDIRWLGNITRSSTLDFTSHAGVIEFVVPRTAAADFTINTYEGGFDDRIGVRYTEGGTQLKGRQLRFTLGPDDAGGAVTVRNFKGTVVLRSRQPD